MTLPLVIPEKNVGESLFLAQVLKARAIMLSFPSVGFLPL